MKRYISLFIALASLSANSTLKASEWGPYAQIMAGPNWANLETRSQSKSRHAAFDLKQGFMVGAAFGYRFCPGFRVEEEYSYRHARIRDFKSQRGDLSGVSRRHACAHAQISAVLVNLLFDIPFSYCAFVPYLGGGAGYGWKTGRSGRGKVSDEEVFDENQTPIVKNHHHRRRIRGGFAWQGIAGITFPFTCNTDIALEYRYFSLASHRHSNTFAVVTRFYF